MTREEALSKFGSEFDGEETWMEDITEYTFVKFVNKIYDNFEQQISNLNSNLEAQEIMIADYKKRIEELSSNLLQLSCDGCKYSLHNKPYPKSNTCMACIRHTDKDDYYKPKGK